MSAKVPFIPFQDVKQAVSIEQIADYLQLKLKRERASLRGSCPVHGGGDRALVVAPRVKDASGHMGAWYCHASNVGGDRIGLVSHIRQCKQYAAFKEVAEAFCPHLLQSPEEKGEKEQEPERGFRPLPYLAPEHPDVEAAGIPPEIATQLGIGFAPRGLHRGRVAFPLRLADGTLVGYISVEPPHVKCPPDWKL